MLGDKTEWSGDMITRAKGYAKRMDGEDHDRGDLETMRYELNLLKNTLSGLLSKLVEDRMLTEDEASDLINKWGWYVF